jgi:hypothetical protein
VSNGAHVELDRVVVETDRWGIVATDSDTTVVAADLAVANHGPVYGGGLWAMNGAHVELRRSVLGAELQLVLQVSEGSFLTAQDTVLHGIGALPDAFGPRGIMVDGDSVATLERVSLLDLQGFGAAALNGMLTLQDVRVQRMVTSPEGTGGYCLLAVSGSEVVAQRVMLGKCQSAGILVGAGGDFDGEDVVIAETRHDRHNTPRYAVRHRFRCSRSARR